MLQSAWQIRLFGGFSVRQHGEATPRAATKQAELLLAILADRIGHPVSRSEICEELWPSIDEEVRGNRFRVLLSSVRRLLEPPGTPSGSVLIADRTAIILLATAFEVDVEIFSSHVRKAQGSSGKERKIHHYKAANQLYAGEFMSGRSDDWILGRRAHYAQMQSRAQLRCSALLEEVGDLSGALDHAVRAIGADPLREAPQRQTLRLLVESGETVAALSRYEQFRKDLKRAVGLVPTAELQSWIAGIKEGRVPKEIKEELEPSTELAQEALTDTPPTRTLLPPKLSSFLGRSTEVAELSTLLLRHRWITLTGPGGIGKTRLATETARANARQFGYGIFYLTIDENATQGAFLETLFRQLQVQGSLEPWETLRRFFAQQSASGRNACLFVLDCLSQNADPASEVVPKLLSELPFATVLAVARKTRNDLGEHEYRVGPLPIPDENQPWELLLESPSARLFVERAQEASARFVPTPSKAKDIVALCRRLEGVPLSIELAAAHVKDLSPSEILASLSNLGALADCRKWREARHQSLFGSLTFSLNALGGELQGIFRSLCVFPGSFDAGAASVVAGASTEDLIVLAEHSLLTRMPVGDHNRYSMLDMVREFGLSKLSPAKSAMARQLHAAYFRQLAADFETLHLSNGIVPLPKLSLELENFRAAADQTLKDGDIEKSTNFACSLGSVWVHTGSIRLGREFIDLIRKSGQCSEIQLARLDAAEGSLACFQDDAEAGQLLIKGALPTLISAGLVKQAMVCRWTLALGAYLTGRFEESVAAIQELEGLSTKKDIGRWHGYLWHVLGISLCELGRFDEASHWHEKAEGIWRGRGDQSLATFSRLSAARLYSKRGLIKEAWQIYLETARAFLGSGEKRGLAYSIEGLGRSAAALQRFDRAARLLGAAQRMRDSMGLKRDFVDGRDFDAAVAITSEALGSEYECEWQAGYGLPSGKIHAWLESLR